MKYTIMIRRMVSCPLLVMHKMFSRYRYNTSIAILMYHRIINVESIVYPVQDGMYVSIDTFRKQIEYLKDKYEVVSLETCIEIFKNRILSKGSKPICCITFDDGWKDFYDNAFPVLLANKVNATVFLPTGFIGTRRLLWTDKLSHAIVKLHQSGSGLNKNMFEEPLVKNIVGMQGTLKEKYEKAIEILKRYSDERIDATLDELIDKLKIDFGEHDRTFLSWEEVKIMNDSKYIKFGSHTQNHVILTNVSESIVRDELLRSKNKLLEEGVVSKSFIPFTYPNGNHTDHIKNIVKNTGYSMALTTNNGLNDIENQGLDYFGLKRIGVHQDMTSTRTMFACRIKSIY